MDQIGREQRWREICREYHESGMTRKAFSESRGVARSTLGYWLKRLPEPEASTKISELVPLGTMELWRTTVLRIRLGGDVVAELDLPTDETVLRDVLRAAASL
jgi:DNA-binding transcriptional regulator LsrR (DeoR family)